MNQRIIIATAALLAAIAFTGCQETGLNPEWARCMVDACDPACDPKIKENVCRKYPGTQGCDSCGAILDGGSDADADVGMSDGGGNTDAGHDAGRDTGPEQLCLRNSECGAGAPRCDQGTCGACKSSLDCASYGNTPACDTTSGSCVECTASMQAHCTGEQGQVCKEGGQECVECNSNTECTESKPHCGADNNCGVCINDTDCAQFGKVCDGGQCVQCTGLKAQHCNGSVCDSANRVCATGILPASAELCQPCVSDAHCGKRGPALCLPTYFGGQELGYFCQPKLAEGESCIGDHRPYVAAAIDGAQHPLASIDGVTDASCSLRATSCQALTDYSSKACTGLSDDGACGVADLEDGACQKVPAQNAYRCSVPCLSSDDCNNGSSCAPGGGSCSF